MNRGNDQEYGSHLPVLRAILEHFKPRRILEIGCGQFSTPLLASQLVNQRADSLVVVEQESREWLASVQEHLDGIPELEFFYEEQSEEVFNQLADRTFDFCFVDGTTHQRVPAIQRALNGNIPVIAFHDSEKVEWYGYQRIDKPDHYFHRHYLSQVPGANQKCTAVISHEPVLLSAEAHVPVQITRRPQTPEVQLP